MSATGRNTRSSRQIIRKALPIEKANAHNVNKDALADFLAADLAPSDAPCLFRIQVALTTAGKFRAVVKKAANAQTVVFNADVNLAAKGLYIFDLLMHSGDTVNFQSDQAQAPVMILRVQEIAWGTQ